MDRPHNIHITSEAWWKCGFDPDVSLAESIARVGHAFADRPAVLGPDGAWVTHGDVYSAARRIAVRLANHRCPVACLTGTNASHYVALSAGILAGPPFGLLDPSIPPARLRAAADEIGVQMVLADSRTMDVARELVRSSQDLICVDDDFGREPSDDAFFVLPEAAGPIYIFTSGSTGHPKGVIRSHRSMLHTAYNISKRCAYEPDDVMLYVGSPGHVGTINDVMCSLVVGHATIPVGSSSVAVAEIRSLVERYGVSKLSVSPSLLRLMLRDLEAHGAPSTLRLVVPSGEPLLRSDLALYFRVLGDDAVIWQSYGSTETGHMYAGWYGPSDSEGRGPLPLTRMAEGVEVEVVDEHGQPVAIGQSGAIRVRGDYLADGYTTPDHPDARGRFQSDDRGRYYQPGDRARRVSESSIVMEGRQDRQVSIHGRRLELGDVESCILSCPGWAEASAALIPEFGAAGVLAAMVSPIGGATGDVESLQCELRNKLEHFAIPRTFVVVPALPKTSTGKVDIVAVATALRTALQSASESPADKSESPQGTVENWIADAWQYVTRSPTRPSRDVRFDAFGGDSLAALALGLELTNMFGGTFAIDFVSQHMSIREQARAIDTQLLAVGSENASSSRIVRLRRSDDGPFVVLVPGIGGHAWVYISLIRQLRTACEIASLNLSVSPVDAATTLAACSLAEQIGMDSGARNGERPIVLVGYSFGCVIATEVGRLLSQAGHRVDRLLLIDPSFAGPIRSKLRRTRTQLRVAAQRLWSADRSVPESSLLLNDEITRTSRCLRRMYNSRRTSVEGLPCQVLFSEEYDRQTTPFGKILGVPRSALPATVLDGLSHLDLLRERGALSAAAWLDELIAPLSAAPDEK